MSLHSERSRRQVSDHIDRVTTWPRLTLSSRSEGQQGDGRQSQGKGSHERRSARNQEVGKEMNSSSTWADELMMDFVAYQYQY